MNIAKVNTMKTFGKVIAFGFAAAMVTGAAFAQAPAPAAPAPATTAPSAPAPAAAPGNTRNPPSRWNVPRKPTRKDCTERGVRNSAKNARRDKRAKRNKPVSWSVMAE